MGLVKPLLTAFFSGLVFALGLGVSGMTHPAKVIGFLDVLGDWDPSLAFVMVGAIGVYAIAGAVLRRHGQPWLADTFHWPTRQDVDLPLILGAMTFGLGWGLAGYCPGPGVVVVVSGAQGPAIFVAAMMAGMWVWERAEAWLRGRRPGVQPT